MIIDNEAKVKLSVIVPVFNEQTGIEQFYLRLVKTLNNSGKPYEIIFVDDGSIDRTLEILSRFVKENNAIVIKSTSNRGQVKAILTGLMSVTGDVVISMDADLQYNPDDVRVFLEKLDEGHDVVFGRRKARKDPLLRKFCSHLFNMLLRFRTGVDLHDWGCSFLVSKKKVVDKIGKDDKFIKWALIKNANSYAEVNVEHYPRVKGKSKYSLFGLLRLAGCFIKYK